MDRIEPIRPALGRSSRDAVRPVTPIDRRPRNQQQEQPPKRPPKRADDGQQHLLDEQA
jgi:hypothetical protein